MDNEAWKYLERFTIGVLQATGKKTELKHVLVQMEADAAKNSLHCFIDGTVEPEMMKDIPLKSEFMVRIKCADKDEGIYLTAKGRACVKDIGHGKEGMRMHLDVKVTGVAAYKKVTDEKGIDSLEPLYNDMTTREDKRAKVITGY